MMRRRIRQQLQHRERGNGLARARLADQCDGFTLLNFERDSIDRKGVARTLAKTDREVCHLETLFIAGFHRAHPNVLRGSKASRTPSPIKIKSESMLATVRKPEMPSQGA